MPVSPKPLLVAMGMAKRYYSSSLIQESGEFLVNVLNMKFVEETLSCGRVSGREQTSSRLLV